MIRGHVFIWFMKIGSGIWILQVQKELGMPENHQQINLLELVKLRFTDKI